MRVCECACVCVCAYSTDLYVFNSDILHHILVIEVVQIEAYITEPRSVNQSS